MWRSCAPEHTGPAVLIMLLMTTVLMEPVLMEPGLLMAEHTKAGEGSR